MATLPAETVRRQRLAWQRSARMSTIRLEALRLSGITCDRMRHRKEAVNVAFADPSQEFRLAERQPLAQLAHDVLSLSSQAETHYAPIASGALSAQQPTAGQPRREAAHPRRLDPQARGEAGDIPLLLLPEQPQHLEFLAVETATAELNLHACAEHVRQL